MSNKAGHCRQGTIVAAVRGTKAEDVIGILMQILEEDRLAVKEVTLDLSSSMKDIVSTVFPNATIMLDCFHVLKRCHDAVEEMRLRTKREAQVDVRRLARKFFKNIKNTIKGILAHNPIYINGSLAVICQYTQQTHKARKRRFAQNERISFFLCRTKEFLSIFAP